MEEKNFHSLSEQLATLFPGQLIVERSGGLIFIGLIWRRGHKSTKSAALVWFASTMRMFQLGNIRATTRIRRLAALSQYAAFASKRTGESIPFKL